MPLPRDVRRFVESGDFESLEDHVLARLESDPDDVAHFVGVGRLLAGNGEEPRAALLLGLVDEQLVERGGWSARLELLEGAGHLMEADGGLHAQILATLERLYECSPSLEGLIELVGLRRAPDDIPKTWEKVRRLRELLQFEVGTVVWMEGKGAGRVVEANLELESFKIDFERHPGLRVGFRAAGKLLRALPPEHFLRRKLERPEELDGLEPVGLLQTVLDGSDRPLTGAEIREAVQGLVPDDGWSTWWTAVRKHPQVLGEGFGARRVYRWAASAGDAREQVMSDFEAADVEGKLAIFRKEGGKRAALRERMAAQLAELGASEAHERPAAALTIWYVLERAGAAPADAEWRPARLLAAAGDPVTLAASLPARVLRERVVAALRDCRDDWLELYERLLEREEDPRLLDLLATAVRAESPEYLDRFVDRVLARPRRLPAAFVWYAERCRDDDLLGGRNPLRVMQLVLDAVRPKEFAPYRARLRGLCESGGVLPFLISRLAPEQGPGAEEALKRAPLEEYVRTPLVNALHLRFPEQRASEAQHFYATEAAIAERRAELKRLLEEEIPANRKAIEEARALGDLSENFEYKSARQRHEYLSARVSKLDQELRRVRPIDPVRVDTAEIRVGSRVALVGGDGARRDLIILGPWESRPEDGILSYDSDLARQLLGKKPGDAVELPDGAYKVDSIAALSSE